MSDKAKISGYVQPETRARVVRLLKAAESLSDFFEVALSAECDRRENAKELGDEEERVIGHLPRGRRPKT